MGHAPSPDLSMSARAGGLASPGANAGCAAPVLPTSGAKSVASGALLYRSSSPERRCHHLDEAAVELPPPRKTERPFGTVADSAKHHLRVTQHHPAPRREATTPTQPVVARAQGSARKTRQKHPPALPRTNSPQQTWRGRAQASARESHGEPPCAVEKANGPVRSLPSTDRAQWLGGLARAASRRGFSFDRTATLSRSVRAAQPGAVPRTLAPEVSAVSRGT